MFQLSSEGLFLLVWWVIFYLDLLVNSAVNNFLQIMNNHNESVLRFGNIIQYDVNLIFKDLNPGNSSWLQQMCA